MKYRLMLVLILWGSFSFAQDLTLHKNQLESLLKNMSLNPVWDDDKKNLSFEYKNETYNAIFYAQRLSETDDYSVFLSITSETGIETDYSTGIYAISSACNFYYTVKGYLKDFDPEKAQPSQKYELITSADLLMSQSTSLNANTLSWTLQVMRNFSDRMRSSMDTSKTENKKQKEASSTASVDTSQEEKVTETSPSNEGNTLSEKEQKRANRKKRAKSTLNQFMNSL